MTGMFVLVGVAVWLGGVARAGEWVTSRGEFCIDECKYRDDANYFSWCYTMDGKSKVFKPDHNGFFGDDNNKFEVDKEKRWDYCTPGPERRPRDEDEEEDDNGKSRPDHGGNDGSRPNHGGRAKREEAPGDTSSTFNYDNFNDAWSNDRVGGNEGGRWGNNHGNEDGHGGEGGRWGSDGQNVAMTALHPQTYCTSPCTFNVDGSTCSTDSDHPLVQGFGNNKWFYCTPNTPLDRRQISAEKMLWCTGQCSKLGADHFTCPTIYGRDKCSPQKGYSSTGRKCHKPCQKENGFLDSYYFCYMDEREVDWEYCGYHDVQEELKHKLEFTQSSSIPAVCADYCQWNDPEEKDYKSCNIVRWSWNETSRESTLYKTWDYCEGYYATPMSGTTIAIVVGCIVGVIVIAVVVSWSMKRAGYIRTRTTDPA